MAETRKKTARKAAAKASPKKKAKVAKSPAKKATRKVAKSTPKAAPRKKAGKAAGKKAASPVESVPVAAPLAPAPKAESAARKFALAAAQLVRDDKCTDVVLLDVRELSQVTDYIVIGTGTSDRQMQSVLDHVEQLGKTFGYPAWKTDTDQRSTWLLLDCVDVVVHLFEPNTRAHYDLEMLWGDAPRIAWERPDQMSRDMAGLHA